MDRVCWLVGHHHTYTDIRDLDYQILVEADCLVNLYEDDAPRSAVEAAWSGSSAPSPAPPCAGTCSA